MKVNELLGLLSVVQKAADHHDESKPNVTYDIGALASEAAAVSPSGGLASVFKELLDNKEVVGALLALLLAKLSKKDAPAVVPAPAVPATPASGPHPTAPVTSAPGQIWPTVLEVNLDLFDSAANESVGLPYKVDETDEAYVIIKTDGSTNLSIHGGAYLHAVYKDAQGPINFEDRGTPYLYGTAIWTATATDGSGSCTLALGDDRKYHQTDHGLRIVNFRAEEADRTGGMDVPVHFPPEANEKVIRIVLGVQTPTGPLGEKPLQFPMVS
jgi:hypothetical protein